jgi:hypothetical protein
VRGSRVASESARGFVIRQTIRQQAARPSFWFFLYGQFLEFGTLQNFWFFFFSIRQTIRRLQPTVRGCGRAQQVLRN